MARAEELGLPNYMGFGRLDDQSIGIASGELTARYMAGGRSFTRYRKAKTGRH